MNESCGGDDTMFNDGGGGEWKGTETQERRYTSLFGEKMTAETSMAHARKAHGGGQNASAYPRQCGEKERRGERDKR